MFFSQICNVGLISCFLIFSNTADAGMMDVSSGIGSLADSVTNSFTALARLITAGSYLGGLAFFISAIMKFKQHKDNPTQIPIGTPISLVLIAAALLFLPSILTAVGHTAFSDGGKVAGPTGTIFESK
ncbi:type IV secretion protein IcmD [Legionella antarctica]|nr:type IV secretion protein IcmD [Legionella antarctica]